MRPTFVYDGDCAFCSSCARFIERRVHTPALVSAWQHLDLAALGLTVDACADAVQWVGADGTVAAGPAGIARLLRAATGPSGRLLWRPAGAVLGTRPVLALAWPAYRWVARNRHRLPGGTAACALPRGRPAASGPRSEATTEDGVHLGGRAARAERAPIARGPIGDKSA